MSYDDDWPDESIEMRRQVIRETIHQATLEELKELGRKRFPLETDPWCEHYNQFLREHPSARYYRADTPEGAEIVYCRTTEEGMWFLPDSGMGILQPQGLAYLKEIVDSL